MVYGRKVGKTVRMNLAGMNSITRIEVPNITREAQNLRRVLKVELFVSFPPTCACALVCSDESSPGLG